MPEKSLQQGPVPAFGRLRRIETARSMAPSSSEQAAVCILGGRVVHSGPSRNPYWNENSGQEEGS